MSNLGGGGNVGGANFHLTVSGQEEVTNAIRNIGEGFKRAGIAGSAGLESARKSLENIATTAKKAEEAVRGFGKNITFIDPKSDQLVEGSITRALGFLAQLRRELAAIDKEAKTRQLLPDVSALRERTITAIKDIEQQLGRLRGASKDAFNLPGISAAQRAFQQFGQIQARAIAENKKFDESLRLKNAGVPQLTAFQRALQQYVALVTRATAENKKFDEAQRLKNSGVPQISAAERSLRSYALMQARATAENKKFGEGLNGGLNFINRHATAINSLSFAAARAGHGFANFLPLIARSSTLFANAASKAGGLSNVLGAARASISGATTALAGVSLVAVAAVAAIALVAVGIGILTVKLGPLGGALNHLKNQISDTFGSASDEVNEFATSFGSAMGLSETAALTFIGRMGQLFQAQGETAQSSARIAEGLLVTATILRDTTIGAGSFEDALRAVQTTLAGNIEGLREYNIFITEIDLRNQAAARGINVASGALDSQTRQLLTGLEVIDQAQERLSLMTDAQRSLAADTAKLGAAFTDVKSIIAQAFGAVLQAVIPIVSGFFENIKKGFQVLRDAVTESESFTNVIQFMAKLFGGGLVLAFRAVGLAIEGFIIGLGGVIKLLDVMLKPMSFLVNKIQSVVNGILTALRALHLLGKETDETATKTRELAEAEDALEQSARRSAEAASRSKENLQKLVDAREAAFEANRQLGKDILDAEIALQRVIVDNARKIEDAQRNLSKAYSDRNKAIEDANEKLSDIEVQNSRALLDARKKLDETRLQAFRSIRDAEEKLAEARLDAAKKVDDAERALDEARQKRQDDILNAQLSVFEAQIKGDAFALNRARLEETRARRSKAVKDAERKLDETAADAAKTIAKLERDLAEERIDQAKKVRDAEIDLARVREDAIERVSDAKREQARAFEEADEKIAEARRRLSEVEIETNRAEFDAQKRLNEVREEGSKKVQELIDKWHELEVELGNTAETAVVLLAIMKAFGEAEVPKLDTFGGITPGVGAEGGHFRRGQLGLVGERGRELVIGGTNGTSVIPNDITERLLAILNGDSAARVSQTVNVTTNREDPEIVAAKVSSRLARFIG